MARNVRPLGFRWNATLASANPNLKKTMISLAVTFLIIGLIAGVLGFTGVMGTATNIAWILFVVGLVLALISFLSGRRVV